MPKKRSTKYECGLEAALDVIGGRWKVLILWDLDRPHRFGELKRIVTGISEKMLIQQLRDLELDGVVIWSLMALCYEKFFAKYLRMSSIL